MKSFEELVAEAESQPFSGWDFSWLEGRFEEGRPSWDYRRKVLAAIKGARTVLDLGTGGGEVLASMGPLPAETYATESWSPNFPVARKRLEPLGVKVVHTPSMGRLPFDSERFDLVIDRHEEYQETELFRILKPGGSFITQQVGGMNLDELIFALLGAVHGRTIHPIPSMSLETATASLRMAGLQVSTGLEESFPSLFYDVGAVVYFLKHSPWEITDFDSKKYRRPLLWLHEVIQKEGSFKATSSRFYIEARKPA